MFWEHSPYSTNIASDWLAQSSPVDEEEMKIKMDVGVAGFFTRFGGICLFVDLWEAQPCLGDPE